MWAGQTGRTHPTDRARPAALDQGPNVTTSCGAFAPSLLLYQTASLSPSLSAKLYMPSPEKGAPRLNSTQVPTGAAPPAPSSEPTAGRVVQVIAPSVQFVSATE